MTIDKTKSLREELALLFDARREDGDHRACASMTATERLRWRLSSRTRVRSHANLEDELVAGLRDPLQALLWSECVEARKRDLELSRRFLVSATPRPFEGYDSKEARRERAAFVRKHAVKASVRFSGATDVLERLVDSAGANRPSLIELARAGQKVAPSPAFEIYIAIAQDAVGETLFAEKRLEELLARPLRPDHHAAAAQDLADMRWHRSEDWRMTIPLLQFALERDPENPVSAMSLLEAALRTGDSTLAREADAHLQSSSPFAPGVYDEKIRSIRTQGLAGSMGTPPNISLSPLGERMLHALL